MQQTDASELGGTKIVLFTGVFPEAMPSGISDAGWQQSVSCKKQRHSPNG